MTIQLARLILVTTALASLVSCGKKWLNGDKEQLVGKWQWVGSHSIDNSGPVPYLRWYTPDDFNQYSLEFEKRNFLTFEGKGGEEKNKKTRIKFEDVRGEAPHPMEYDVLYHGDERFSEWMRFRFSVESGSDTLICYQYPYSTDGFADLQVLKWNKFVRVK